MKEFYPLCFTLFSFSSFGSYLLGVDISWECVGNNQYVFTVDQYVNCIHNIAVTHAAQTITGPTGTIQLPYAGTENVSLPCGVSTNCLSSGYIERNRFRSAPVTLQGSPPPAGWEFAHEPCCFSSAVNLTQGAQFSIKAKMYANTCNSSPHFVSNPVEPLTSSNNLISCQGQSAHPDDSLYYRFLPLMSSSATPAIYANGYSYTSPFPSTTTNPANGPVILHSKVGMIETNVQTGVSGAYNYGIVVEQWRNQVLIGEIGRNAAVSGNFGGNSNNTPSVNVDTTLYPSLTRNGRFYTVEASPGDTIDFEMVASDMDYNSSTNQFQIITFTAGGRALDTLWNGIANYSGKPALSPGGAQTGYASPLSNRINFNWAIAQEHVGLPHIFHFQFFDDECSTQGVAEIILTVNVKGGTNISADTSQICQGDSIQLTGYTGSGNYIWSPAAGLSSITVGAPYASPSSSQYYYLEDPQNPGVKDSVYLEVIPSGTFNMAFTNGQLEITDNAQTTNRTWYYNGIPFNYPHDTLTPFGLGDYYVIGRTGGVCRYVSDTITISSGMSFSVTSTGNGSFNGSPMPFTGSLGVTFQVDQNVNVSSVSIPGVSDIHGKTGGYDLKLQIFDDTQTEIFKNDVTLQRPIGDVIKINAQLAFNANSDYTLVVTGDTGYAFSLYENVQLPASPHNVGLTVKSVAEGAAGQFPTMPTDYLLPISMGIDQTVSVNELTVPEWQLYPNPAVDAVTLTGLKDVNSIEMIDVNGKMTRSYSPERDQENFRIEKAELPSGLYFIKVHFEEATSVKKVLFK